MPWYHHTNPDGSIEKKWVQGGVHLSKADVRAGVTSQYLDNHEFYAILRGAQMKDMPDIPIVCRPLIDTSTHQLAIETDPVWSLRIRHCGCWQTKTRPKVRIYCEGRKVTQPALCFDLPSQALFTTLEDVHKALSKVEFRLSGSDLTIHTLQKLDDLTTVAAKAHANGYQAGKEDGLFLGRTMEDPFDALAHWNTQQEALLKARRPKLRPAPSAEIVSLHEYLAARGVPLTESEEPSELSATA